MELILLVGPKRIGITVDESSKVRTLMELVAEETKIREINQKLIFKGETITKEPDKQLSEFGVKNKSKIMVVGRRYDSKEEAAMNTFYGIENAVVKLSKEVDELKKQTKSIKGGFLQKEYQVEAFEKIKYNLKKIYNTLMTSLETIDSMSLLAEFKDAKLKRKVVVDKVQSLMDQCDSITWSIDNE